MKKFITLICFLTLLIVFASAQDVTLTGPGTCNGSAVSNSWTVPCTVSGITIEVYGGGGGAGGGGGGSNGGVCNTRGGGGGGGGGFTTITISVVPGSTFNYSIGAGGCGGGNGGDNNDGGDGSNGSNSTFSGTASGGTPVGLTANGGLRGTHGNTCGFYGGNGNTGSGGAGGSASGGTTNNTGSSGNNGSGGTGGTGGAGAGTSGGAGGASNSAPGNSYGGGGAGGGDGAGGSGAAGSILITYTTTIAAPVTPTTTSTPPTCTVDGTSTISNYDPGATYNFTPSGPTVGAGGVISGMVTGTSYTVVSGTGACASPPSTAFSNAASTGNPATPTVTTTPPSCTADGASTINNYNASYTYTFTPTGPTAGAGGAITGMTTGTSYTVEASNAGCNSSPSSTFSNAAQLPATVATVTGPLSYCTGGNTTLTASGGNSYIWADGGGNIIGNTANITVTQGTYGVLVTNSSGCMDTVIVTVTEQSSLTVNITGTLSYCQGGNTTITASGGTGYVWSDAGSSTTAAITVTQGNYSVTATDAAGCTGTASAVVTENTLPTISITGTLNYCPGANTTITASGATGYIWNDAGSSTTAAITVTQGTYTVTGTDANGCTATANATVTENTAPTVTISGSLTYCTGGSSTLTASGGSSYVWNTGSATDTVQVTQGTYDVTATDANGCTGTTSAVVSQSANLTVSIAGTLSYCPGSNTTLTASGGSTYLWSDGSTTAAVTATQGAYSVTATDASCTGTATANVTQTPAPVITISGNLSYCAGTNTTLTASGGTTYVWNNANNTASVTVTQGTYTVTGTDGTCSATATATVTETTLPALNLGGSLTACQDSVVVIDAGNYSTYTWSSGETTPTLATQIAGTYSVTVHDATNCSTTGTVSVTFKSCTPPVEPQLFIPTAFSPNGDGLNDLFRAKATENVKRYSMRIYNRWGELVYESTDVNDGWDGMYKGVAQPLSSYVWYAEYTFISGGKHTGTGNVTLVR